MILFLWRTLTNPSNQVEGILEGPQNIGGWGRGPGREQQVGGQVRFLSEVSKTNLDTRSALQSPLCVDVGLAVFQFSES